jgi:hypothetical protein
MSPSHATKRGRRYRYYYVSQAMLHGRKEDVGSVARVPAMELERRVIDAVRGAAPMDPRERSTEAEIPRRVSDRPRAAINSPPVGSSPRVLDPGRRHSRRSRTHHDPPHDIRHSACRRHGRRLSGSDSGHSWTPPSPYRRREIIQGGGGRFAALRPMRAEARASHWRVSRRVLLARRTDERFEPHVRVHRRAREEDRALDSHEAVALLSFTDPRQGCDRGTAVPRLWRQAFDGPSDGLVGSMVRARSLSTRTDLIETPPAQPLTRG